MRKNYKTISNPDELDKHLQHISIPSWIILGIVVVFLLALFIWSFLFKIEIKITGEAKINNNDITLIINESDLKELKIGQIVQINDKKSEILSFDNDGMPIISTIDLDNGEYNYSIIIKEKRPIEFLIGD